jgi:uncharacterized C2H2 Zn-finger protein
MTTNEPALSREQWQASEVGKASVIACGRCGLRFESAQDFYAHLDAEHPKKKEPKRVRAR